MGETEGESTGKARLKVPFHLPGLRKPQIEYRMEIDNSNTNFVHVGLERCDDGVRFLHPLEKFSVSDFVDRSIGGSDEGPMRPPALEDTPFMFVEKIEDLEVLVKRLEDVNEMAIDLEHNHYRSFQGLTCLMQISTRAEDFVVDTLKLRAHVGPHLNKVFRDPSKRKVLHGAGSDILWLQKDFGIYVCNMFDTGQASRVLKLEKRSLKYLLRHYCGVIVNKEYQSSDWRLRPLPDEMVKYAREDTHYLLYLYDIMRRELISLPPNSEYYDALLEVYRLSFNICLQLYEKELISDTSYLHIHGIQEADFSSEQLAVVACRVCMNGETMLLVLKMRVLDMFCQIRHCLKLTRYPIIVSNLHLIIRIVRNAVQIASSFDKVSEELKKRRLESIMQTAELKKQVSCGDVNPQHAAQKQNANGPSTSTNDRTRMTIEKWKDNERLVCLKTTKTVKDPAQLSTKRSRTCGVLEVKSCSRRTFKPHPKYADKEDETKAGHVRCSGSTQLHPFARGQSIKNEQPKIADTSKILLVKPKKLDSDKQSSVEIIDLESGSSEASDQSPKIDSCLKSREHASRPPTEKGSIEIIDLESSSSETEQSNCVNPVEIGECFPVLRVNSKTNKLSLEAGTENVHMRRTEVASSFQKCFEHTRKDRDSINKKRQPLDSDFNFHSRPQDHAIAGEEMRFTSNQGIEGRNDCNASANSSGSDSSFSFDSD